MAGVDNLKLWKQVEKTDPEFTKQFKKSGGFSGTSVNPIYLAEKATKIFGPCGIKWGHEEIETKIVEGPHREFESEKGNLRGAEQVWFSHVKLWYVFEGERGEVSHWGSSSLVVWRRGNPGYFYFDDEAAKKARTNAVSKCFSLLGFSADLWKGYYENEEYIDSLSEEFAKIREAERFENTVKMLDSRLRNVCGCESEDDLNAMCQWATGEDVTYGEVTLEGFRITPSDVLNRLSVKAKETKWPDMLQEAKNAHT